jgi:hypothetical protein
LTGVEGLMATAFQQELVIWTDCELLGRTPSDQEDAWSQLPLVGLIQEFTGKESPRAKFEAETNVMGIAKR